MKKIKILIVVILIVIVIILGLLFALKRYSNYESKNNVVIKNIAPTLMVDTSFHILENNNTFYTIERDIRSYYAYIIKKDKNVIYNLLDKSYINKQNININNILDGLAIQNFEDFWMEKIYYKVIEANVETKYYIKGTLLTQNYKSKKSVYIIVTYDFTNNTYSITPCNDINLENSSYEEIIQNLIKQDNGGMIAASETQSKGTIIEKNKYNSINIRNIDEEDIVKMYLERAKINIIYYSEDVYKMLDIKSRNKFNNLEECKRYFTELFNDFKVDKYKISEYNDYRQYTLVSKDEKKIVFKETLPMQYTIMLEGE